jgi:hypothetical protein
MWLPLWSPKIELVNEHAEELGPGFTLFALRPLVTLLTLDTLSTLLTLRALFALLTLDALFTLLTLRALFALLTLRALLAGCAWSTPLRLPSLARWSLLTLWAWLARRSVRRQERGRPEQQVASPVLQEQGAAGLASDRHDGGT